MTTTTQTEQLVTLVRQRLVLEEVVMTKEEFNAYNKRLDSDFYWSELDWKDSQFPEYCEEQTYYTAYEGDVTSFTDDCVSWLSPDDDLYSCYDKLKIRKSSLQNYAQSIQ